MASLLSDDYLDSGLVDKHLKFAQYRLHRAVQAQGAWQDTHETPFLYPFYISLQLAMDLIEHFDL